MLSTTDKTNITNRSSYQNSYSNISDNNQINIIPEYNNDDDDEAKNNFKSIKENVKTSQNINNNFKSIKENINLSQNINNNNNNNDNNDNNNNNNDNNNNNNNNDNNNNNNNNNMNNNDINNMNNLKAIKQIPTQNFNNNLLQEIENENNNYRLLDNLKDNSNLLAVYDNSGAETKFTFYNSNKFILGSFNFRQIIKYIGKQIEPTFYNYVDSGYSEELIKTMIGEILIDPITGKINIILKSHLNSPFMGNLDLLIKLNNSFINYETKDLLNDIVSINNEKLQYNLKISIKQFIYLFINHTLKIISIISENIKNDSTKTDLNHKLLKYSVSLVYRISNFMKEHIDTHNIQYKKIYDNLEKLINMKKNINNKVNNLEEKIKKQNELIYSIINKEKHQETSNNTSNNTSINTSNNTSNSISNNVSSNISNNASNNTDYNKLFNNNNSENQYDSEFIDDNKSNSDKNLSLTY